MLHTEKQGSLVSNCTWLTCTWVPNSLTVYKRAGDSRFLKLQLISFPAQLTFTSKWRLQKAAVCCSISTLPILCTGTWLACTIRYQALSLSACNIENLGGAWGWGYQICRSSSSKAVVGNGHLTQKWLLVHYGYRRLHFILTHWLDQCGY